MCVCVCVCMCVCVCEMHQIPIIRTTLTSYSDDKLLFSFLVVIGSTDGHTDTIIHQLLFLFCSNIKLIVKITISNNTTRDRTISGSLNESVFRLNLDINYSLLLLCHSCISEGMHVHHHHVHSLLVLLTHMWLLDTCDTNCGRSGYVHVTSDIVQCSVIVKICSNCIHQINLITSQWYQIEIISVQVQLRIR